MRYLIALSVVLLASGCATVQPWQKGNLAKPNMAFDPDRVDARLQQHIYASKEAASGGNGVAAGGCGCN
jgi:hypothetical protein